MTAELEYRYEVKVERRDKPIRLDAAAKEALRDAGMMNNNKLKITGVSPKMLKTMKLEYVECPVLDSQVHFVQCFVCPNFQSRLNRTVLCRGAALANSRAGTPARPNLQKRSDAQPEDVRETPEPPVQAARTDAPGAGPAGAPPEQPPVRAAASGTGQAASGRKPPTNARKEEIGITEPKSGDFSEWYTQVVLKAELADYAPVKGMIALRPDGYSIWESIKTALDAEFARVGVRNAFLPVLIPESLLTREKTHFEGFNPEVFWVTHSGDAPVGDRLALRPTSETIAYSLYSKWINSWRDLPLKLNFWNTALRAEIKSTKPFLRTSEFLWQEGHTVHATREEAAAQVEAMLEIYRRVIEEHLAIPVESGRKSAREQFVGAEYTLTVEAMMPDGKALQMGTSHLLGQNFAKPFSVKFADKENVEQYAWQTSWGVSWRLIGALIMVHGDDRGLVLPPRVAPIQAVIVPVHSVQGDKVWLAARDLAERLRQNGCRAHVDDRQNVTTGYKYGDWELRGVPLRVEIGPRDLKNGAAMLVRRDTGAKEQSGLADIAGTITGVLETIQSDMLESARRRAAGLASAAQDYESLVSLISDGGFVRAHWCGNEKCEETIKEETGADIRLVDGGDGSGPCVVCGSPSVHEALFARGY